MRATISLPERTSLGARVGRFELQNLSLAPASLPRVERIARHGPVLHTSPLGGERDILSLNLTRGCAQRCAFCSVRASPHYRGNEVIQLYADGAAALAAELKQGRPRAVYLSPAADPFPPLAAVQAEAARIIAVLAEHGVEAWVMTRGFMRPSAMAVLAAHRAFVQVTVGLTTLDRTLQRRLEPLTASPSLRLRQLAQLFQLGIRAQAALEPLIPGLTDTRDNLLPVLEALAGAGVRHVTAGYLFLRSGIRDNLLPVLETLGCEEMVLDAYAAGPLLAIGQLAPATYLPKARRQRGYAHLMSLASQFGIQVRVSELTNPDFAPPRQRALQPSLF